MVSSNSPIALGPIRRRDKGRTASSIMIRASIYSCLLGRSGSNPTPRFFATVVGSNSRMNVPRRGRFDKSPCCTRIERCFRMACLPTPKTRASSSSVSMRSPGLRPSRRMYSLIFSPRLSAVRFAAGSIMYLLEPPSHTMRAVLSRTAHAMPVAGCSQDRPILVP